MAFFNPILALAVGVGIPAGATLFNLRAYFSVGSDLLLFTTLTDSSALDNVMGLNSQDRAGVDVQANLTSQNSFSSIPIESLMGESHLENAPFELLGPAIVHYGKGVKLAYFIRGVTLPRG